MKALSLWQPGELKRLSLDEYINAMIQLKRYDADTFGGFVLSLPRNRKLFGSPNADGYHEVTLYYKGVQKTALVHRIIALKHWGIKAIQGKQVAHLDHNPSNNTISNLWVFDTVKEHNEYDGVELNLIKGQMKTKESWDHCVRCGDPDGVPFYARKTPARITGKRFGYEGDLCWRCYHLLDERQRRALKKAQS